MSELQLLSHIILEYSLVQKKKKSVLKCDVLFRLWE